MDNEHSVEAREVLLHCDFRIRKGVAGECGCGRGVLIADFQDQAAAIYEMFWGCFDQAGDIAKAVGTAIEALARLVITDFEW